MKRFCNNMNTLNPFSYNEQTRPKQRFPDIQLDVESARQTLQISNSNQNKATFMVCK